MRQIDFDITDYVVGKGIRGLFQASQRSFTNLHPSSFAGPDDVKRVADDRREGVLNPAKPSRGCLGCSQAGL